MLPMSCEHMLTTLTNSSQYYFIDNTTIHYAPLNSSLRVLNYSEQQFPIVCLNNSLSTHSFLGSIFIQFGPGLRESYYAFVLMAAVLMMAALLLAILLFIILKEVRAMFGCVVLNLGVAFFISDVLLVLQTFLHYSPVICTLLAIAEHFCSLLQFSWLAILGVDFALRFYRVANSLGHRSLPQVFITYQCIGWGVPFCVTLFTVIIHFSTHGRVVQYGLDGRCHIVHIPSTVIFFSIPIVIAWMVCLLAVFGILVYLYKLPFNFDHFDKRRFCFMFMFIFVMAILHFVWMWVLLDGSLVSHVISLFTFLAVVGFRSVLFTIAFVINRKVLNAARRLCCNTDRVTPQVEPAVQLPCPTEYENPTFTLVDEDQQPVHPVFRSRIAAVYPEEAEMLSRLMSEPSAVPKIHKCSPSYYTNVRSKNYFFYGTGTFGRLNNGCLVATDATCIVLPHEADSVCSIVSTTPSHDQTPNDPQNAWS